MTPDSALIVIRSFIYADLLLLFGLALFGLYGLGTVHEALRVLPLRSSLFLLATAGIALSFMHLAAMAAAMAGTDLLPPNLPHMTMLIQMGGTGTAFIIRFVSLAAILPLVLTLRFRPTASLAALCACAGVAVGTLAWAGHGAMQSDESFAVHLIADIIHLLAAGGWIGALGALFFMLLRPERLMDGAQINQLANALQAFAGKGTLLVGTVVATGIVNVWSVVGWAHLGNLLGGAYGRLLAAKLVLFLAMFGLAGSNRLWLVSALDRARQSDDTRHAVKALRVSLAIESACALLILALVAALGLLAPPR
ncbi:MAG: copper homeostasis membrane protein CopD [Proteobacteria bacterium]|nr:copper homeostasis membrane protein CopD [Pseudomonadota bacterium]